MVITFAPTRIMDVVTRIFLEKLRAKIIKVATKQILVGLQDVSITIVVTKHIFMVNLLVS